MERITVSRAGHVVAVITPAAAGRVVVSRFSANGAPRQTFDTSMLAAVDLLAFYADRPSYALSYVTPDGTVRELPADVQQVGR